MTDIARRPTEDEPPIIKLISQYRPDLAAALPEGITPDRFYSTVINLVRQTPQLLNAEPLSIVSSVLLSAQLGLEPGAPMGLSWIIPRRNGKRLEASMQIGYKGLVQLAYRSGHIKQIDSYVVHLGDDFDYRYEIPAGWVLNWTPQGTPDRPWTHVFSTAATVTGGHPMEIMSYEEVIAHRDRYAQGWNSAGSAWKRNEPEMAKKVVTARLCRQLPMSSEFRQAMAADGSTPREIQPDLAGMLELEATTADEEATEEAGDE
jgi:recombination protein RecT